MPPQLPERYGDGAYTIRRLTAQDVDETYVGWMADPDVTRFLQARFRDWDLESLQRFAEGFDYRDHFLFAIEEAANHRWVGTLTLRCNPHHHFGVIGFMIGDRNHWGRGAAKSSISATLDFAFFERNLRKVIGTVTDDHVASNAVFAGLGFAKATVTPDLYWSDGAYRGEVTYVIGASDWATRRGRPAPAEPAPPVDAVCDG